MSIKERLLALSKNESVGLFGVGVSAIAAKSLLNKYGIETVFYAESEAKTSEGKFAYESFNEEAAKKHSLIVYSPAFRPDHPWLKLANANSITAICEPDLSAIAWEGELIAVTGTNGKTTTTSFITHVLLKNGFDAIAAGNIGQPLSSFCAQFDDTRKKIAVCEISSFQSINLKFLRPNALIWTNFDADHLDWHKNMTEYFDAKLNLAFALNEGIFIAGESVEKFAKKYSKELPDFTIISNENKLPLCPAPFDTSVQARNYTQAKILLMSMGIAESKIIEATSTFSLAAHRFSKPIVVNDVNYYDDSKATNVHAALAAINELKNKQNLIWLGGGKDKYCDLSELVAALKKSSKGAVLIGQTAQKLEKELKNLPKGAHVCANMQDAVKKASELASPKGDVLFSPAFSSFGMFKSYSDRGKSFENAVLCLKNLKI